jgi:hypothetical protein
MLGSAVVVTTSLLAACGGDDDASTDETTTTENADTTTTAADTTTTGGSAATADAWTKDAVEHRGQNGTEVKFDCPAGGTLDTIWGTETYTDDSSVCSAAVHVGLITVEDGGKVTIEIQPGQAVYDAGEANGVTSQYYGAWTGSFTFPDAPPGSGQFAAPPESWRQSITGLVVGDRRALNCSPGGPIASVWGTGLYTSDSSICTAAVLEGLITVADGGVVVAQVVEGQDSYTGSTANGVTSQDYGSYSLSFELPEDQPSS